jgi:hypothetical protein
MSCITWFQYDGDALVAEYDGNHNLLLIDVHPNLLPVRDRVLLLDA